MPSPADADVGELLRRLVGAGVEFIVVGGAAAVLHGAPITTEGHVLLSTRLGPLDCFGTLVDGRGFEDLVSHSESIEDEGSEFRVVDLSTLIDIKTKTGRAKDRLMLPILVALAEELEGSKE